MRTKKPAAVVVAGVVAVESVLLSDPKHRKEPHAPDAEHNSPRPVAKLAIEYQSTATSYIAPMTGMSIWSTGAQTLFGGRVATFNSSGWFSSSR